MSNVKLHKVSSLGLQRQLQNIETYTTSRLGIPNNQLDYEDSFKPIDSKYVKLLIERLSVSHFINNTFDAAKDYIDSNSFIKNQTQKDLLAALSSKKDAISIAKERIPNKTKKTKEQLEQELEESNYFLLSKSLFLNTTVAFIDNGFTKNGHNLNIDYKNKIISYSYVIYYKVSDELIVRDNNEIKTSKSNYAIILNSGGVETLFFFVEKVYSKKRTNSVDIMRENIYKKYLTELNKTTNIETLVFLYDNLPNYIKLGYDDVKQIDKKPYKLPDDLLWKHLEIFVNYDKWSDASYYVLFVMSMISPKFLMKKFLTDQSLVVTIYNGLDDQSPINEFFGLYPYSKTFDVGNSTFEPTNKDSFVSLINAYIQLFENDPQVAVFESSGAHFHQGTKKGGKYDPEVIYRLDSNLVFSDDKKDKVLLTNYWESKQYLGQFFNQQGGVSEEYEYDRGYNESGYYNPLDVVKFTQYNDKGEAITLNVPAIFVKHASDFKEWEKVNEGIRLGVNVIVIIASVATIYSGVSSVFLTAAIADIGLASADIIIQSEKDNLKRSEKGKEFLESWEKIYIVGGVVTFSPVAVKAVATYGPKIVSSGADLLQVTGKTITNPEVYKKVKDLTTKAIHSLEIPNFNKTGLEILKKGFTEFAALKNAKKLQELGVIFAKGAEDTIAVIYKGFVIASGKISEVRNKLERALFVFSDSDLKTYLDEWIKVIKNETKNWTRIDEFDGLYQGKQVTYYDVNLKVEGPRPRAGIAYSEYITDRGDALLFELNIEDVLQKQGIGTEIFKRAIDDYNPVLVKAVWKKLDIYTNGESVNLINFRKAISNKIDILDAVFETPTGIILKRNGFNGIPEIIKNTDEEVIIYFNKIIE